MALEVFKKICLGENEYYGRIAKAVKILACNFLFPLLRFNLSLSCNSPVLANSNVDIFSIFEEHVFTSRGCLL